MKKLFILGAGGFAREVAWLVKEINTQNPQWELQGFVEHSSDSTARFINDLPIISLETATIDLSGTWAVAAIGNSANRARAVRDAEAKGIRFATLVHPSVKMHSQTVSFSAGTIICAGTILTTDITIGKHVIINLDCTVGHDSIIEDFVTISPGVHLSGHTKIRHGAYIGTGAVTIERLEIGENAVVGAGAVVTRDIPSNVTACGVPARPLSD